MRQTRHRSKPSRPSPNAPAALLPDALELQERSQAPGPIPSPIRENDLEGTRAFFAIFRSKWSVIVMCALDSSEKNSLRRRALGEHIPDISEKVLTDTLRHLARAGLVQRHVFASVPSRVEYSLTEAGCKTMVPLRNLLAWCRANHHDLQQAMLLLNKKSR